MKQRRGIVFFLILVGTWAAVAYLPWWTAIIVSFLGVFIFQTGSIRYSFLLYGLAGIIVWLGMSLYADFRNDQVLSVKMVALFHLPNPAFLWIIEAIIGFISAGLGAWLANRLKDPIAINKPQS